MKTCTKCGVEKPKTDFHKGSKYKDGLCYQCKDCANKRARDRFKTSPEKWRTPERVEKRNLWKKNNPEKLRAYEKSWQQRNPEKAAAKHHRQNLKQYGITAADYEALLLAQDGVCAICKQADMTGRRLAVDHIHGTSPPVVRGLCCQKCNRAIGLLQDSPKLLFAAAEYLRKADPLPEGIMPCY